MRKDRQADGKKYVSLAVSEVCLLTNHSWKIILNITNVITKRRASFCLAVKCTPSFCLFHKNCWCMSTRKSCKIQTKTLQHHVMNIEELFSICACGWRPSANEAKQVPWTYDTLVCLSVSPRHDAVLAMTLGVQHSEVAVVVCCALHRLDGSKSCSKTKTKHFCAFAKLPQPWTPPPLPPYNHRWWL